WRRAHRPSALGAGSSSRPEGQGPRADHGGPRAEGPRAEGTSGLGPRPLVLVPPSSGSDSISGVVNQAAAGPAAGVVFFFLGRFLPRLFLKLSPRRVRLSPLPIAIVSPSRKVGENAV